MIGIKTLDKVTISDFDTMERTGKVNQYLLWWNIFPVKLQIKKIEKLVIRGGKYKCAIILSITTILIILAEPLIKIWMGKDFMNMVLPTQIYLSYWFLLAAWGVTGAVLLSLEKYKPILVLNIVAAIGNLILSLILVQWYGVLGVIMGTTIPYLLVLPLLIPYGLHLVGVNIKKYIYA